MYPTQLRSSVEVRDRWKYIAVIDVPAEFAKRADALVPVPFGFGNAAFVPDEVDEFFQAEAAVGNLLIERAGGDAALRVA